MSHLIFLASAYSMLVDLRLMYYVNELAGCAFRRDGKGRN